jgi:hypothetical protein
MTTRLGLIVEDREAAKGRDLEGVSLATVTHDCVDDAA